MRMGRICGARLRGAPHVGGSKAACVLWALASKCLGRRLAALIAAGVAGFVCWPPPAYALIERLTPLATIIDDSDEVFVAHFDSIDVEKPSAIIVWDKNLQGKATHRRLPINLAGDKEKHTPQFLKRIAPKRKVVLFVVNQEERLQALGYADGTWFQLIGTRSDDRQRVRWAFTHCEIYLRRTYTGTTDDLIAVVTDAVSGKQKPPKPNPKEPPGWGPEVPAANDEEKAKPESKKEQSATREGPGHISLGACRANAAESSVPRHDFPTVAMNPELVVSGFYFPGGDLNPLFWPAVGVVTLPFLAPLAALLQLLFPGLLRDQWRRYRIAVSVLMTQSSLLTIHWIVVRWFVSVRPRWLADDVLWGAMVAIALVGALLAWRDHWRQPAGATAFDRRPAPVEYMAVGALLLTGLAWAAFQFFTGGSPFDQMFVLTVAACAASVHLWFRAHCASVLAHSIARRGTFTTELVLLWGLVVAGAGLGLHVNASQDNQIARVVTAEWPMFRGAPARAGSVSADDLGPHEPAVVWIYDPKERKGRIRMHSSPAVVDDQVYIGALYELQSQTEGAVYCVNAGDGRSSAENLLEPGRRVWRFTAEGSLKPVFSSPTVSAGRVYFGEGYHQDQGCRLFCLDARQADRALWTFPTNSHVESSPCIVGTRIYFGAGDDGIICLDAGALGSASDEAQIPQQVWQFPHVHVDASCLVVDGKLFVGSVTGDVYKEFCALAIDAQTGRELWRVAGSMPLPASPAYAAGRVFFGLGNGKFDFDAEQPAGAVLCLDAATGKQVWQHALTGSVLATPAISGEGVVGCSRDGRCLCLSQDRGAVLWNVDLGTPIVASPIVAGGNVYVLTLSGLLACLNAQDGSEAWRLTLDVPDEDAYSSPTLAAGRIYVAAGGKLYCIGERKPQAPGLRAAGTKHRES